MHAFFGDGLDRRTREGRIVAQLEQAYARHKGFPSFAACPLPLQDVITMVIGLKIFVATHRFDPGSATGARDFHTALNSLARLVISLGLDPVAKKELSLAEYIQAKQAEALAAEAARQSTQQEEINDGNDSDS